MADSFDKLVDRLIEVEAEVERLRAENEELHDRLRIIRSYATSSEAKFQRFEVGNQDHDPAGVTAEGRAALASDAGGTHSVRAADAVRPDASSAPHHHEYVGGRCIHCASETSAPTAYTTRSGQKDAER